MAIKELENNVQLNEKEMICLKRFNTKKLVLSALFAALTCACTMAVTIPTPTGGYVHAGDCFIILAGVILGPVAGGLAGGIGSMLSDIFLGYLSYAPATFIIKFLAAFAVGLIFHFTRKLSHSNGTRILQFTICGLVSNLIVIVGYFLYEWLLTSNVFSAALSGILGNSVQGLTSILLSTLLYSIIPRGYLQESLSH